MNPQLRPAQVAALLFCSGLCALIYQTVWLREFRLIFGASTAASAAVLGIFMGGLGLGSAFLGKRAEASPKPLKLYGDLELLIAVFAAVTPGILWGVRELYAMTGGTVVLGQGFGTVVRLLMASIVLVAPTFLMGGTLPAAARSIATDHDPGRRRLALLYGTNTLGAVTGAAISTFWLVEVLGNHNALWVACALNVLVAVVARALSAARETVCEAITEPAAEELAKDELASHGAPPRVGLVIASAAIVGFAFMLMELVWYRMLGPILGGSTFTFGLILVIALLGIGLGGVAYTLRGANRVSTLNGFALTCALEALFIVVPYALGDRLAYLALMLRPLSALGFGAQVFGWAIVGGIVIFPAAMVAGYQFPMLISLLGRGRADVARHTGQAYAANTIGAIIGSLAGGFGLLPLITAVGVWKAVTALLVGLAAVAVVQGSRTHRRSWFAPVLAGGTAVILLFATGPTAIWRHAGIGAGRADSAAPNLNYFKNWGHYNQRVVVWEAEGVESSVALSAGSALAFVVNGKVDGNTRSDAGTQVVSGLIGALLHPNPKKAMVVGLGTGATAGWLGALPELERVDVVELEPAILEVARKCSAVNCSVMDNPKVHCHVGDAREVLITTPEQYDVIFSEPSNPYRAGIASLFTVDFYRAAQRRLAPKGIFAQWTQAYEIETPTFQTVVATLSAAFPHVEIWHTQVNDLILVASMEPIVVDVDMLRKRVATPVVRQALLNAWRNHTVEGFLSHFIANEELARHIATAKPEIATDDRNPLEYGFARGIGKNRDATVVLEVRGYARRNGLHRPRYLNGEVDWDVVDALDTTNDANEGLPTSPIEAESALRQAHRAFFERYLARDHAKAWAIAKSTALKPLSPLEIEALAECAVILHDPSADAWIKRVEGYYPVESRALRAMHAMERKEWSVAAEGFAAVFREWQTDPWVRPQFLQLVLASAQAAVYSANDPKVARLLFDTLGTPFAVELHRELRLATRVELAKLTEPSRVNPQLLEAYHAFGRNPDWSRKFLEERLLTYRALKDPMAEQAETDLKTFIDNSSEPFDTGLQAPAHTAKPATPAPPTTAAAP